MSKTHLSRLEGGLRLVLKFVEALNRRDTAGMGSLLHENSRLESAEPTPEGSVYAGKETIIAYWQDLFVAHTQLSLEIEEVFGLGQRCVARWRMTRVDGSGIEHHMRGVAVFRMREDLIGEVFLYVKGGW